MGDLHDHRHAVQQDDLVAPVELVGFPRSKASAAHRPRPSTRRAPWPSAGRNVRTALDRRNRALAQLLEDPDQRQLLADTLRRIARQQLIEF